MSIVGEEGRRRDRHHSELRRLFTAACLSGSVFFRGNDRSPSGEMSDVVRAATAIVADVTPEMMLARETIAQTFELHPILSQGIKSTSVGQSGAT